VKEQRAGKLWKENFLTRTITNEKGAGEKAIILMKDFYFVNQLENAVNMIHKRGWKLKFASC
jgi:hypothetical protein